MSHVLGMYVYLAWLEALFPLVGTDALFLCSVDVHLLWWLVRRGGGGYWRS